MRRVDCSTRLGRQEERRVFPYIARAPTHRSVARTKGIGIAILSRPAVPPSRRLAVEVLRTDRGYDAASSEWTQQSHNCRPLLAARRAVPRLCHRDI